jgi:hypothetical protein
LGYGPRFDEEVDEDEDNNPLSTILSLTNSGLSINLELIPIMDPDYVFGVLNLTKMDSGVLASSPIESYGAYPYRK